MCIDGMHLFLIDVSECSDRGVIISEHDSSQLRAFNWSVLDFIYFSSNRVELAFCSFFSACYFLLGCV